MQIECPACKKANEIQYGVNIKCGVCKEKLSGHFYKCFKKPLISTSVAVCIAAFGGYQVEKAISDDRYPMAIEYELINICSSEQLYSLPHKSAKEKTSLCVCALEKTVDDIVYSDFKENEKQFVSRFKSNIVACY
ncbi:MAG: hypothetical protein ACJAWI_002380 [Marinomonas primoryensis]|jgi:hypothetical protein